MHFSSLRRAACFCRYLSFLKGIVDSDTLPLSVSRETLQAHASLKVIKKKIVRKVLDSLKKMSDAEKEGADAGTPLLAVSVGRDLNLHPLYEICTGQPDVPHSTPGTIPLLLCWAMLKQETDSEGTAGSAKISVRPVSGSRVMHALQKVRASGDLRTICSRQSL